MTAESGTNGGGDDILTGKQEVSNAPTAFED